MVGDTLKQKLGEYVKVRIREGQGSPREYTGFLMNYDNDFLSIRSDGKEVILSRGVVRNIEDVVLDDNFNS